MHLGLRDGEEDENLILGTRRYPEVPFGTLRGFTGAKLKIGKEKVKFWTAEEATASKVGSLALGLSRER